MKRGRIPDAPMRMVIRQRLEDYTIRRRTDVRDSLGQTTEDYTDSHSERLWLYNPDTTSTQLDFGERTEGDLAGLGLPDADVDKDDRIEYGGHTYEVSSPPQKVGNESMNDFISFSLTLVQD